MRLTILLLSIYLVSVHSQTCSCPHGGELFDGTSLCYTLETTAADWNGANVGCDNNYPIGSLVEIQSQELSNFLASMASDAGYFEDFDIWIGASSDATPVWTWVSGPAITFNLFAGGTLPASGDHCALLVSAGFWTEAGCSLERKYFCEYQCVPDPVSNDPDSGTGDPHMVVHLPQVDLPVCFDYLGNNQEVVRMIQDDALGLTVNAKLVSKPMSTKTFFQAVNLSTKDCSLTVDFDGIIVNGMMLPWHTKLESQNCGSQTTFSMLDGSTMEIDTVNSVQISVVKQGKTNKRNMTFDYLNLFVKNQQHLSSVATGLIGQFTSLKARVYNNGGDTDQAVIVFPDTARKSPVSVSRHHKREPLSHRRISCWYVKDATALIGSYADYKVL